MTHEYEYEGRCCGPNCNNANGCVWDNTHCVDKWGQCGIKEEEVSSLTSDEHHYMYHRKLSVSHSMSLFFKQVAQKCGAMAECEGVVCRADFGGYCLARHKATGASAGDRWGYVKVRGLPSLYPPAHRENGHVFASKGTQNEAGAVPTNPLKPVTVVDFCTVCVGLRWTSVQGATGYQVFYRRGSDGLIERLPLIADITKPAATGEWRGCNRPPDTLTVSVGVDIHVLPQLSTE